MIILLQIHIEIHRFEQSAAPRPDPLPIPFLNNSQFFRRPAGYLQAKGFVCYTASGLNSAIPFDGIITKRAAIKIYSFICAAVELEPGCFDLRATAKGEHG